LIQIFRQNIEKLRKIIIIKSFYIIEIITLFQPSLFDANKNLLRTSFCSSVFRENDLNFLNMFSVAEQMGFWAKNICGSSYFFGNTLASSTYLCIWVCII